MVLDQNWPFFLLVFLSYIGEENFYTRNWIFFKEVRPWFWSTIGHFFIFLFLGNIAQDNVFYDILERKYDFLDYKNNKFTMSKN